MPDPHSPSCGGYFVELRVSRMYATSVTTELNSSARISTRSTSWRFLADFAGATLAAGRLGSARLTTQRGGQPAATVPLSCRAAAPPIGRSHDHQQGSADLAQSTTPRPGPITLPTHGQSALMTNSSYNALQIDVRTRDAGLTMFAIHLLKVLTMGERRGQQNQGRGADDRQQQSWLERARASCAS